MISPALSIITVNYNNMQGLEKTLASVRSQSFQDYEHIIIDAGSTDGSARAIKEYATGNAHVTYWVSEHDNGIYDGMNKGIDHAGGAYLLFLNSGDMLDGDILHRITFDGTKIIYGDVTLLQESGELTYREYPYPLAAEDLIFSALCHQACFIHHSLFDGQRYRTDYKIVSDWIHTVENIMFRKCSYAHIPFSVAIYDCTGISTVGNDMTLEERSRWIKENIPDMIYDSLKELSEYRQSPLSPLIPLLRHTRRFQYRMKRLVIFLYRINELFSRRKGLRDQPAI